MIKFTKKVIVNTSEDKIWETFAHGFNDAYKWMASVSHSYSQANGESFDGAQSDGRVCELSSKPDGIKASEKFLAYDEKNKTVTVKVDFIDTPALFPVNYNLVDFSLRKISENQCEMIWEFSSKIKPLGYLLWPLMRIGFGVFVKQIIEELKYYVEHGTPHPRKIKAMEKKEAKLTLTQ
ncbi:MAG: hypothetical protein ACI8ZM_004710 [Crocinitomix sp.]|jgi:hypothetical protein